MVLKFNGKAVKSMRSLPKIVAETEIDKRVEVELWRNRKTISTRVSVGELDEEQLANVRSGPAQEKAKMAKVDIEDIGLSLSALTEELRKQFNLKKTAKGVVIVGIEKEGSGAEKGLAVGDVIVEVSQKQVNIPKDVEIQIKASRASNRKSILLLVEGKTGLRFIALRLSKK